MSGLPLFTELAGKSVLGNPGDDSDKRAGNQPSPFLFTSLFPCKSRDYSGALGRTRTCDLLIRSHSPSGTRADTEGQGETKLRFYRYCDTPEGTGEDRERHPVAVRLRSKTCIAKTAHSVGREGQGAIRGCDSVVV